MSNREIIDFEVKGNQVKFYLGKNGKQWGDDWDDAPYEYNAEQVYREFIEDTIIKIFDYDGLVLEPATGAFNSGYCKRDMIDRKIPCVIYVPKELTTDSWETSFEYWRRKRKGITKFYFGDVL